MQMLQEYECFANLHGHPKTEHEKRTGAPMSTFAVTEFVKAKALAAGDKKVKAAVKGRQGKSSLRQRHYTITILNKFVVTQIPLNREKGERTTICNNFFEIINTLIVKGGRIRTLWRRRG